MSGADAARVAVTTTLRAKPGCEEALEKELLRIAAEVRRAEPGCLLYQPARSQHDSRRFLLVERYRNADALAAHANSDHLREALPALMAALAAPPELSLFHELAEEAGGETEA